MNIPDALYLLKPISSQLYLGVVIPFDSFQLAFTEPFKFIDPQTGLLYRCTPVREFGGPIPAKEENLSHGYSCDILEIEGSTALAEFPVLLVPGEGFVITKRNVRVRINPMVAFDRCGVQAKLWIAAYGQMKYPELMGVMDEKPFFETMDREHKAGDIFAIELECGVPNVCVLTLKHTSGHDWDAELCAIGRNALELDKVRLTEIAATEIDEVRAVFRRPFGQLI